MRKRIILYSGGMDSLIMSRMYEDAERLYVALGTRYAEKEIARLPPEVLVDRRLYLGDRERSDAIVPDRNLFLVMIAAMRGDDILLGATAGDLSHDKNATWAVKTSDLLNYMRSDHHSDGKTVSVHLPIKHLSKGDLVAWWLSNNWSVYPLLDSVSCYSELPGQCGVCKSCMRKWLALRSQGIGCSSIFNTDPRLADWSQARAAWEAGEIWRCESEDAYAREVLSEYNLI